MKKRFILIGGLILSLIVISVLLSPIPLFLGKQGHVEYCEHHISDNIRVRLAHTPYSTDPNIDPNNWSGEPLAHDFLPFNIIIIPFVDYEVTQDGGTTWKIFWRYNNTINESPWCDAFDQLDANTFWVWARSGIAITHDSGKTWLVPNGYEEWDIGGDATIDYVNFETRNDGRIVFVQWQNAPDPTLLTNNGGQTWYPDPNWTPPTLTH